MWILFEALLHRIVERKYESEVYIKYYMEISM